MLAAVEHGRTETQSASRNVSKFQYTPCYCEENIYMLCKALSNQGIAATDLSDLFVVFISNDIQQIPIWRQRNSSSGPDGFCVWDYHVVCIQKTSGQEEALVWDLDTTLPLPVLMHSYVKEAFRPDVQFDKQYSRLFRVIRASAFTRSFASDRRHMKTVDGRWLASPPAYDCIKAEDGEIHNLGHYNGITELEVQQILDEAFDQSLDEKYGVVISEEGLRKAFNDRRQNPPIWKLDAGIQQVSHSTDEGSLRDPQL